MRSGYLNLVLVSIYLKVHFIEIHVYDFRKRTFSFAMKFENLQHRLQVRVQLAAT